MNNTPEPPIEQLYVVAYDSVDADPKDKVWTLSTDPKKTGWETDAGYAGYGLTKAAAEAIASVWNTRAHPSPDREQPPLPDLQELAVKIAKGRQRGFWAGDRPHEKAAITSTLEVLKCLECFGYRIVRP